MGSDFIKGKKIVEQHVVKASSQSISAYDYLPGKLITIPSRKGVKKAFKREQFYKEGELIRSLSRLKSGDLVSVVEYSDAVQKVYPIDLNVVYEDEYLAVVEKPSGLPTSGNRWKTLQNALPENIEKSNASDALVNPLTVHRLDAKTHGLIIIAKTMGARIKLGEMFANREIQKTYVAIIQGELKGNGIFNLEIEGKKAITHFEVLNQFPTVKDGMNTVVKLNPVTGRKHQLRIHLAKHGTPIIGDVKYSEKGNVLKGKGLFLSACALRFQHPVTNEEIDLSLNLPNKFNRYESRMENWYQRNQRN